MALAPLYRTAGPIIAEQAPALGRLVLPGLKRALYGEPSKNSGTTPQPKSKDAPPPYRYQPQQPKLVLPESGPGFGPLLRQLPVFRSSSTAPMPGVGTGVGPFRPQTSRFGLGLGVRGSPGLGLGLGKAPMGRLGGIRYASTSTAPKNPYLEALKLPPKQQIDTQLTLVEGTFSGITRTVTASPIYTHLVSVVGAKDRLPPKIKSAIDILFSDSLKDTKDFLIQLLTETITGTTKKNVANKKKAIVAPFMAKYDAIINNPGLTAAAKKEAQLNLIKQSIKDTMGSDFLIQYNEIVLALDGVSKLIFETAVEQENRRMPFTCNIPADNRPPEKGGHNFSKRTTNNISDNSIFNTHLLRTSTGKISDPRYKKLVISDAALTANLRMQLGDKVDANGRECFDATGHVLRAGTKSNAKDIPVVEPGPNPAIDHLKGVKFAQLALNHECLLSFMHTNERLRWEHLRSIILNEVANKRSIQGSTNGTVSQIDFRLEKGNATIKVNTIEWIVEHTHLKPKKNLLVELSHGNIDAYVYEFNRFVEVFHQESSPNISRTAGIAASRSASDILRLAGDSITPAQRTIFTNWSNTVFDSPPVTEANLRTAGGARGILTPEKEKYIREHIINYIFNRDIDDNMDTSADHSQNKDIFKSVTLPELTSEERELISPTLSEELLKQEKFACEKIMNYLEKSVRPLITSEKIREMYQIPEIQKIVDLLDTPVSEEELQNLEVKTIETKNQNLLQEIYSNVQGATNFSNANKTTGVPAHLAKTLADGNCFYSAIFRSAKDLDSFGPIRKFDLDPELNAALDTSLLTKIQRKYPSVDVSDEKRFIRTFRKLIADSIQQKDEENPSAISTLIVNAYDYLKTNFAASKLLSTLGLASFLPKRSGGARYRSYKQRKQALRSKTLKSKREYAASGGDMNAATYATVIQSYPDWFQEEFPDQPALGTLEHFIEKLAEHIQEDRAWAGEIEVRIAQALLHDAGVEVTILNTVFDSEDECVVKFMPKDSLTLYNEGEAHYVYFSPNELQNINAHAYNGIKYNKYAGFVPNSDENREHAILLRMFSVQYPNLDKKYFSKVHIFSLEEEEIFSRSPMDQIYCYPPNSPHYQHLTERHVKMEDFLRSPYYYNLNIPNIKQLIYYKCRFKYVSEPTTQYPLPVFAKDNLLKKLNEEYKIFSDIYNKFTKIETIFDQQKLLRYITKLKTFSEGNVLSDDMFPQEGSRYGRFLATEKEEKEATKHRVPQLQGGTHKQPKQPHKTRRYKRYLRRSRKATSRK